MGLACPASAVKCKDITATNVANDNDVFPFLIAVFSNLRHFLASPNGVAAKNGK
jgi:hypothetical protein